MQVSSQIYERAKSNLFNVNVIFCIVTKNISEVHKNSRWEMHRGRLTVR